MSGQFVENAHKALLNGGTAIAQYRRVKLAAGVLSVAGLADAGIGITSRRVEADVHGDVWLHPGSGGVGTQPMVAAVQIAAGDAIYTAADGEVSNVQGVGSYLLGYALEAASGDGAIFEVQCQAPSKPYAAGAYTFVADDDSAGTKGIDTGLDNIASLSVQLLTNAGVQTGADAIISHASGVITIADGSSYKLTATHVAYWQAFG